MYEFCRENNNYPVLQYSVSLIVRNLFLVVSGEGIAELTADCRRGGGGIWGLRTNTFFQKFFDNVCWWNHNLVKVHMHTKIYIYT